MDFKNENNWKDMPVPEPREDEYREIGWGYKKWGEPASSFAINRPKVADH